MVNLPANSCQNFTFANYGIDLLIGLGTTQWCKIMTQMFIATISFSLSLLAFCAGAWLTIWATSSNTQCTEVSAAKLTGYFIAVLAIVSLVFTSYYAARSVFGKSSRVGHTKVYKMSKHSPTTKTVKN